MIFKAHQTVIFRNSVNVFTRTFACTFDRSFDRSFIDSFCRSSVLLMLPVLLLAPLAANSQSKTQLDRLIFDPVLLDPSSGNEVLASSSNRAILSRSKSSMDLGESLNALSTPVIRDNIVKYVAQLESIEETSGPFSTELYETLLDLANQYQLHNDHEKAIETFERAEYVSRINHGLAHPEQFASIEGLIESYLAVNDFSSANEKQNYLAYLHEQYFGKDSMNALPSLINLAERHMENYQRTMAMPIAPTIRFTAGNGSGIFSSRQPSQREMAFGSLYQAQFNYSRAISAMINNRQFFDPDLLRLEYRFIETLLLQSFRSSIIEDPDYYLSAKRYTTGSLIKNSINRRNAIGYFQGKTAFDRMLIYVSNNPQASIKQLVDVLMDYGDWQMLFGRTKDAMKKYTEANNLLQLQNTEQSNVEQILYPATPVHLPLITPKPNSREKFGIGLEEKLEYEGYIDIAFTISRYGRAKQFDTIAWSGGATRKIERRLIKYLRNSPFRPRLQPDGSFNAERVNMRYYFTSRNQML